VSRAINVAITVLGGITVCLGAFGPQLYISVVVSVASALAAVEIADNYDGQGVLRASTRPMLNLLLSAAGLYESFTRKFVKVRSDPGRVLVHNDPHDRRLIALNRAGTDLRNIHAWWEALTAIEQANPQKYARLVRDVTAVLAGFELATNPAAGAMLQPLGRPKAGAHTRSHFSST